MAHRLSISRGRATLRNRRGWAAVFLTLLTAPAWPEPVRNGNEFALQLAESAADRRPRLIAEHRGLLHVFRCLRVLSVHGAGATADVILTTTEPSSDATVILVVPRDKTRSIALAAELTTNDCVAARGRLEETKDAQPPVIRVAPALLEHKDRPQPKVGREMLDEMKQVNAIGEKP
jgi:hypothetical protein